MSEIIFNPDPARPLALLEVCPAYAVTPLHTLPQEGAPDVLIKDESVRMGLGAFKALGGAYAVAALIGEAWHEKHGEIFSAMRFTDEDVKAFAGTMTFICASAGNHGMAVAAGARIFGARARIHLADTVPEAFAGRLRDKGAEVVRSGAVYAESVDAATADAEASGALLLADGSWPGYTHPPSLVMEGYTVIAEEMRTHFEADGGWPDRVYLQAGVGGLAAGIAHMIRRNWHEQPELVVVEPEAAPCLGESAKAGKPVAVEGPVSNMGRLDCKEPSIVSFAALEAAGVRYITVSDEAAQAAADELTGLGFGTTPSGAAGYAALKKDGPDSCKRPLLILSECAV